MVDYHPFGQCLLGTHIPQRSHEVAGHRHAGVGFQARQAEVGNPKLTRGVNEQVRRLHVAVDDAVLMGVIERFGSLDAQLRDGAKVFAAIENRERREGGAGGVGWLAGASGTLRGMNG